MGALRWPLLRGFPISKVSTHKVSKGENTRRMDQVMNDDFGCAALADVTTMVTIGAVR